MSDPVSLSGTGLTTRYVEVAIGKLRAEVVTATQGMQQSFTQELTSMKGEINEKLGGVMTQINSKISALDQTQHELKESGKQIVEEMDKQQAKNISNLHDVIAGAQSEFNVTRGTINEVVSAVKQTQSTFEGMVNNMRNEVDTLKTQVSSLTSVVGGGTFGAAADDQVKKDLEALRAEVLLLKSHPGGGTIGAAAGVGGGKLGGFIQWKDMTPKAFGSREELWRDWVEEVRDYFDLFRPGMKAILMAAELERDAAVIDATWASNRDSTLGAESTAIWRALKK